MSLLLAVWGHKMHPAPSWFGDLPQQNLGLDRLINLDSS